MSRAKRVGADLVMALLFTCMAAMLAQQLYASSDTRADAPQAVVKEVLAFYFPFWHNTKCDEQDTCRAPHEYYKWEAGEVGGVYFFDYAATTATGGGSTRRFESRRAA